MGKERFKKMTNRQLEEELSKIGSPSSPARKNIIEELSRRERVKEFKENKNYKDQRTTMIITIAILLFTVFILYFTIR